MKSFNVFDLISSYPGSFNIAWILSFLSSWMQGGTGLPAFIGVVVGSVIALLVIAQQWYELQKKRDMVSLIQARHARILYRLRQWMERHSQGENIDEEGMNILEDLESTLRIK